MLLTGYGKNERSVLQIGACCLAGFLVGLALLFALSLPDKYAMTLALGVIAAPVIFLVQNKEKLLLGGYLFSLPLTMGFMLINVPEGSPPGTSLGFSLYLCDVFLISAIFVQLLKTFSGRRDPKYSFWQNRLVVPLVLWLSMGFVSFIPAIDRTAVAIEILRIVRIFLTFFCIFHFVKGQKEIHFGFNCLLLALLFQALLMFVQYATNSLFISFPGSGMELDIVEQGMRPGGTMGHSSNFAKFSGLILPIALAYVYFAPRLRDKLFILSIWVCGSVALVLTISRAGLATWFLSMIMFLAGIIFLRIISIRQVVPLFLVIILWISSSAGMLYMVGGQRLERRIAHDTGSAASRIPMWKVAFNVIRAHPITGVGLGNYTFVDQDYDHTPEHISVECPHPVHNLFLLYAAEMGIPGVIFFLWFIWELLRAALRCARRIDVPMDKATYLCMVIGIMSLFLQSITGKGVKDHLIHLSIIAIFAACVAKQSSILNQDQGKSRNLSRTKH